MTARAHRTARRLLLRAGLLALVVVAPFAAPARAESPDAGSAETEGGQAAHRPVQIPPEIPVRRASEHPVSGAAPLRWVLILGVALVAGIVLVQGRRRAAAPRGAAPLGLGSSLGRWLRGAGADGGARLVQSIRLTPRASVHVLRWEGEDWLLACGEGPVTLLGRRAGQPDGAPACAPVADAGAGEATP